MGKRTAIYLRISDDREGRELGTQRQHDDCRRRADREGDTVIEVYKDNDIGASNRSRKKRPDYRRMLADAQSGKFEKIIAYTSGRLTRRPREHEDQIELAVEYGIEFAYVASPSFDLNTSAGRRIARTLAANDAGEAEDISERASREKEQAALAGRWRGGRRPFGYEPDGVTVRLTEAAIVREMCTRLLSGESLRGLARDLNQRGVPTSMGAEWTSMSLRDLLMRTRNIGKMERHGEIVADAEWPAIIDEGTWRAVRHLVTADGRRPPREREGRVWPGAGLYRCGICADGTTLRAGKTPGSRAKRPAYRCRSSNHLVRAAEPVDDLVERVVLERLSRPDAIELVATSSDVDLTELHTEANTLRQRLDEIDDDLDSGAIDRARWARRNAKIRARLTEIEGELASASAGSALDGVAGNPDLERLWYGTRQDRSDGLPVERRMAIIDAVVTVTLLPAPKGRQPGGGYFAPDSVQITPRR